MKRFTVLAFCLISALAIAIPAVDGQTNVPAAQSSSQGAANGRSHATSVHPSSRNIARGPASFRAPTTNSGPGRTLAQPGTNFRAYSPSMRPLNPTLASTNVQQTARTYNPEPVPHMRGRSDIAPSTLPITKDRGIAKTYDLQRTRDILARRKIAQNGLRTPNAQNGSRNLQPTPDNLAPRETLRSEARHNWRGKNDRLSDPNALRSHRHEWHDRNWWKQHCKTIVFVTGGYYFLDAGYWYPAWGYDPLNSYYDYDGPIYTYGNLLPDQVIANVQAALQDAGYYFGPITGSLSVETRAALANYQRDYGLLVTGAIDEPTVESLGLY